MQQYKNKLLQVKLDISNSACVLGQKYHQVNKASLLKVFVWALDSYIIIYYTNTFTYSYTGI